MLDEDDFSGATLEPATDAISFARIPAWILLAGLRPGAVHAYAFLKLHLRDAPIAFPSMLAIGLALGLAASTAASGRAKPYLDELIGVGALERERRRLRGMRVHNRYLLHWLPPDGYTGPMGLEGPLPQRTRPHRRRRGRRT